MTKRIFQWMVVGALLVVAIAPTRSAMAWGNCASQITVQWGDTLSSIATLCGTTVEAIQAANPGLGWWLWAGQVLYIPTGYTSAPAYQGPAAGGNYTIQWGDTLGNLAASRGYSVNDILAVNPQIWNANLVYPGQVINLPGSSSGYSSQTPNYSSQTPSYPTYGSTAPGYSNLKVTNGQGLIIRSGPGMNYARIESDVVAAVYQSAFQYRKNSITLEAGTGFVWVEITFSQPADGYSTGWIMVRDGLSNYFTNPKIGPFGIIPKSSDAE